MKYHQIDLSEIKASLDSHYNRLDEPGYKGYCTPECGEKVTQEMNECPVCRVKIVWLNSKVWKAKWGKPQDAIRRMSAVEPDPHDEAGQLLMQYARLDGFANQSEKDRWDAASRRLTPNRIIGLVKWCKDAKKQKNQRRTSGRGLIGHALALIEKVAREEKPVTRPAPVDIPDVADGDDADTFIVEFD